MFGKASLSARRHYAPTTPRAQTASFSRAAGWKALALLVATLLITATWLPGSARAEPVTYTIAGRIAAGNVSLYGVTISAGPGYSTEVNSDGTYLLQGLPAGTYTITPTRGQVDDVIYSFQPATRTVTLPPNAVNQDFAMTRVAVDYGISGCVTDGRGAPLADVTISVSAAFSVRTGGDGCYGFFATRYGTYTLTPSKPGYTFMPLTRSLTLRENASDQDFVGSGPTTLYMPLVEVACPTFCGAVQIENGGVCCIGGPPGATITIPVRFAAASATGAITGMRTDNGNCRSTSSLDAAAWEPFVTRRTYTSTLPAGWSSFAVRAQYRDAAGNVSPVYCAEVALEGYEPPSPMP